MSEPIFHVARNGHELGSFTSEEVKELVESGFLHPTDEVWVRGMTGWHPLEDVFSRSSAKGQDWRNKVIAGTSAFSGMVGRRVGRLVAGVKARAAQGQGAVAQARTIALEQFLPQFQKRAAEYLRDKPAELARSAMRNEDVARKVFGAVHDLLPKPLCRFVTEADFVKFCMQHRQRLLPAAPVTGASSHSPQSEAGRSGDGPSPGCPEGSVRAGDEPSPPLAAPNPEDASRT